jgi:hypothetical protein
LDVAESALNQYGVARAEKLLGDDTAPLQMVDPLYVIETVMRYFFGLAQSGHKANAPLDEVRKRESRAMEPHYR